MTRNGPAGPARDTGRTRIDSEARSEEGPKGVEDLMVKWPLAAAITFWYIPAYDRSGSAETISRL